MADFKGVKEARLARQDTRDGNVVGIVGSTQVFVLSEESWRSLSTTERNSISALLTRNAELEVSVSNLKEELAELEQERREAVATADFITRLYDAT